MARTLADVEAQVSEMFNVAAFNLGENVARTLFASYGSRGASPLTQETVEAIDKPVKLKTGIRIWKPGIGWTME